MLITKPKKAELVTLYDITLDAENRENSHKIRQYVKKIKLNNGNVKRISKRQAQQDQITKHLEYMLVYLEGILTDDKVSSIECEIKKSIEICKDHASEAKGLRMENREMMSEMFKKLEKVKLK